MIKNKLSTLTMVLSLAFFLFASAFTMAPELTANETAEEVTIELVEETPKELIMSGCQTCTFGSNGAPNGCRGAGFCGMSFCEGSCDMSGELCGECAGCDDPTVPCEA